MIGCGQAIHWWNFEFAKVDIPAVSTGGTAYRRRVSYGMPRISSDMLFSTFYLYHTVDDARAGRKFGGTGFFVGYPTGVTRFPVLLYAVTNWHVAVRDGASVMRINKVGGGVDIFEFDPSEWEFMPGGPDLAVVPPARLPLQDGIHSVVGLHLSLFLDRADISLLKIGPGEDVFMVGRFIDHDGAESNAPAARFGNISVMPQVIAQETGANHLTSYILDMHSRTGFSGSPVFVYRTLFSDLTDAPGNIVAGPHSHFIKLLGIHWGQFPEKWEIASGKVPSGEVALSANATHVLGLSGMTLALPAWQLKDFLGLDKFAQPRAGAIAQLKRATGTEPLAESAGRKSNPRHREDFTSLLQAAAKRRPQGDQTYRDENGDSSDDS
jgi:hypothetical protein